jgi:hypothetical protein
VIRSAVVLFAFNRPDVTRRVFQRIRECRPPRLFLVMDGPRAGVPADMASCSAVRGILEEVDWPCEVRRDYSRQNLGLKRRISSGLDWVFESSETAIVLEDDCLPHPEFFSFCDALLDRYRDDDRVFAVTGDNFQDGRTRGTGSYYFSRYSHCWGWATWRRAWAHYDGDMESWPGFRASAAWPELVHDPVERAYWERIFAQVRAGSVQSWAYPWMASIWSKGGLTATPNVNLVENIGFDHAGTNAVESGSNLGGRQVSALGPLDHPDDVRVDAEADAYAFDHVFGGRDLRWPRSLLGLPRRSLRFVQGLSARLWPGRRRRPS